MTPVEQLTLTERAQLGLPSGGVFFTSPGVFLRTSHSPDMRNVRVQGGELLSIPPTISFSSTVFTSPANGSALLVKADGTIRTVLATASELHQYDFATDTFVVITRGGGVSFAAANEIPWCFATLLDSLYFSNDTDGIFSWDGSSNIAANTTSYACRHVIPFAGRLVTANTLESATRHADRVRWTGYLQPTVWDPTSDPTAGFNDLVDTEGSITGLAALGSAAYIFKRNSITSMSETGLTTPSFTFQTVVDGLGTICGRSVQQVGHSLFFLGEDDVYKFSGTAMPESIGAPVRRYIQENLNYAAAHQAFAFLDQQHSEYWLCLPLGTAAWASHAFVFNWAEGTWAVMDLPATVAGYHVTSDDSWDAYPDTEDWDTDDVTWDGGTAQELVYIPFYVTSDTYTPREWNEAGFTMGTSRVDTSDDLLDAPGRYKTVHRVVLHLRARANAVVSVQLSVDGGVTWSTAATTTLSGVAADTVLSRVLSVPRTTGEFIRTRVSSTALFDLLGIQLEHFKHDTVR